MLILFVFLFLFLCLFLFLFVCCSDLLFTACSPNHWFDVPLIQPTVYSFKCSLLFQLSFVFGGFFFFYGFCVLLQAVEVLTTFLKHPYLFELYIYQLAIPNCLLLFQLARFVEISPPLSFGACFIFSFLWHPLLGVCFCVLGRSLCLPLFVGWLYVVGVL